jgi:hypothetical protein
MRGDKTFLTMDYPQMVNLKIHRDSTKEVPLDSEYLLQKKISKKSIVL